MIEKLDGFPDDVVAIRCHGQVSREDYRNVVIPAIENAFKGHERVRVYYEVGKDFAGFDAGAVMEDFKAGMRHILRWERVAVVTDIAWIRNVMSLFSFLMPGQVRMFPSNEADQARAWIVAGA